PEQVLAERSENHAGGRILGWMFLPERRGDCVHFRLSLGKADAETNAADGLKVLAGATGPGKRGVVAERAENLRRPSSGIGAEERFEIRGEDAGDEVARGIQGDRFARDRRVRAELPLPKPVAQEHHVAGGGLVLLRTQIAAEFRTNAEGPKEIVRDAEADQFLRIAPPGENRLPGAEECQLLETVVAGFPVGVGGEGGVAGASEIVLLPDHSESLGMRVRQGA